MYRIIEGRGTGKTSRLMLLAKETNGTIVCHNPRAMEEKAKAYGIVGINFMSYHDFFNSRGMELGNYYIDEMESFVRAACCNYAGRGNFNGYTLSLE